MGCRGNFDREPTKGSILRGHEMEGDGVGGG